MALKLHQNVLQVASVREIQAHPSGPNHQSLFRWQPIYPETDKHLQYKTWADDMWPRFSSQHSSTAAHSAMPVSGVQATIKASSLMAHSWHWISMFVKWWWWWGGGDGPLTFWCTSYAKPCQWHILYHVSIHSQGVTEEGGDCIYSKQTLKCNIVRAVRFDNTCNHFYDGFTKTVFN